MLGYNPEINLEMIGNQFGRRLGKIIEVGKRCSYPIIFNKAVNEAIPKSSLSPNSLSNIFMFLFISIQIEGHEVKKNSITNIYGVTIDQIIKHRGGK